MDPIEIDVVLQLPIPVAIRWPDQDITGRVTGGGDDTVILPDDPPFPLAGREITVWFQETADFTKKVTAYDPATKTATVNAPWSDEYATGKRIQPTAGMPYAIKVVEVIELPRLGVEGLIPWLDDITRERRAALREGIKKAGVTGRELAAAEASAEMNTPAVVTDLNVPVQTPAGIRRILQLSLAKTNLPPDRQAVVLERLLATGATSVYLANRLSGLFVTNERRPAPKLDVLAEAKAAFPGLNLKTEKKDETVGPLGSGAQSPGPITTGSQSA